jgi:hypothetical protein
VNEFIAHVLFPSQVRFGVLATISWAVAAVEGVGTRADDYLSFRPSEHVMQAGLGEPHHRQEIV